MRSVRLVSVLVLASAAGLSGCANSRTLNIPGRAPDTLEMSREEAQHVDEALNDELLHSQSAENRCEFWKKRRRSSEVERRSEFFRLTETEWCARVAADKAAREEERVAYLERAQARAEARAEAARKKQDEEDERRNRAEREAVDAAVDAAARRVRLSRLVAEELRTGRCAPGTAKRFLGFVADIGTKFSYMRGESWETVDSRVLVLTDKPKELMTIDGRGEDHAFGLSLSTMQLHVVDSDGNEVQRGSIYQEMVADHLVSRSYRATGRPFTVSASGSGCAVVVVMRKL